MKDYRQFFSSIVERGAMAQSIILLSYSRARAWEYAEFIAQQLLCDTDACNKRVIDGIHPDIHVVREGEKGGLKVDDIRSGCDFVMQTPYEQKRRVLIIDRADLLSSQEEAANALLKTLEEPPQRATIILITAENESLLPTIRSRCQTFRIYEEDYSTYAAALRNSIPDAVDEEIRYFFERTDILPEEIDLETFREAKKAFEQFIVSRPSTVAVCDFADEAGGNSELMISFLYTWCRDKIAASENAVSRPLLWPGVLTDKNLVNSEKLLIIMEKIADWQRERRRNINKKYILLSLMLEYFEE